MRVMSSRESAAWSLKQQVRPAEKCVLLVMSDASNGSWGMGRLEPLAELCGMSVSNLLHTLAELLAGGFVVLEDAYVRVSLADEQEVPF